VKSDYAFLILSVAGLFLGLGFGWLGLGAWSVLPWMISAAIGLYVSAVWVFRAVRRRELGSDILAIVAIVSAGLINEWLAAAVISAMLATGRSLERWAEGRARRQLEALLKRAPQIAHRIGATGQVEDLKLSEISIGDRLLVRSGEVVPLDGELLTEGTFDEAALTGESLPRWRAVGEEISSGVVNSAAAVEIRAIRDAESSTYSNLIRLVEQAQATSATSVRMANKWAVWFVPLALGMAGLAWLISGEVNRAVAVIVAATPCPLILAVPVAVISGMSKAAAKGAIIKGGAALEQLARTKTVMLDKTGTLTHGGPQISAFAVIPGASADKVLGAVASLEQASAHIVANALVAAAQKKGIPLAMPTNVVEDHGHGLSGQVGGHHVVARQVSEQLPEWAVISSALQIEVLVDAKLVAVVGLDDPLRHDAEQTVRDLRNLEVDRILLVSGDRQNTADRIGTQVGVDEIFGECTPERKLELVATEMANTSGTVVVVGDGINDAPALAAAHVGVAMGARGSTAASEAADVVIVEDSIRHLAVAIEIAKGARRRALQASGVGMGLALATMTLGAFGLINVTASAVAQELIDATAIIWALVPVMYRVKL